MVPDDSPGKTVLRSAAASAPARLRADPTPTPAPAPIPVLAELSAGAFLRASWNPLLAASVENGAFSMPAFSTTGFRAVNGLLTFRCLPNMPAFHVSALMGR